MIVLADLHLADVVHDRLGDRGRQRLHVQLARDLLEHPAFLDAGRSSAPVSSSGTTAWIALSRRTRSRSTCTVSPAHGVALGLLEHDRRGLCAVHAQIQHRARAGERQAQLAGVRVEAQRLAAAAVQRPRARARRGAGGEPRASPRAARLRDIELGRGLSAIAAETLATRLHVPIGRSADEQSASIDPRADAAAAIVDAGEGVARAAAPSRTAPPAAGRSPSRPRARSPVARRRASGRWADLHREDLRLRRGRSSLAALGAHGRGAGGPCSRSRRVARASRAYRLAPRLQHRQHVVAFDAFRPRR